MAKKHERDVVGERDNGASMMGWVWTIIAVVLLIFILLLLFSWWTNSPEEGTDDAPTTVPTDSIDNTPAVTPGISASPDEASPRPNF